MNCKKIKNLIITDYIDNQLNERIKKQVEGHLSTCVHCREFEKSVQNAAVQPFKNLKEIMPADSVWQRIKENIEAEQSLQQESILTNTKNYLQPFFNFRRPVFATITVAVALVIVTTIAIASFNQERQINNFFQEQEEFLNDLGTANPTIEELFL